MVFNLHFASDNVSTYLFYQTLKFHSFFTQKMFSGVRHARVHLALPDPADGLLLARHWRPGLVRHAHEAARRRHQLQLCHQIQYIDCRVKHQAVF